MLMLKPIYINNSIPKVVLLFFIIYLPNSFDYIFKCQICTYFI